MPILILAAGLALGTTACTQEPTDLELEKMCNHLAELREKPIDKIELKKCIEEAKKEGISREQALCRISAVNAQEYWNRCRTGKARQKPSK